MEVRVDELSPKGVGVTHLDALVGPQKEPKTYQIHVRKGVPGDVVEVEILGRRRRTVDARIVRFVEASPMRRAARCAHFGLRHEPGKGCGGCTLQSLDYRHQLMVKERMVKRLMQRAGVDPGLVLPVQGLDEPWYYRNKMEFSVGTDGSGDGLTHVGLHPTGFRHDVLALTECHLESEFAGRFVGAFAAWLNANGLRGFEPRSQDGWLRTVTVREGKRTGGRMILVTTTPRDEVDFAGETHPASYVAQKCVEAILELSGGDVTSIYWIEHVAQRGSPTRMVEHHMFGDRVLLEELQLPGDRRLSFEIHPSAFFQPNTMGAEALYAKAIEYSGLEGARAGSVLDLYCGTGTIGLCMAPYVEKVTGVELNAMAVENARRNAHKNQISNVEFFAGDVAKVMETEAFKASAGDVELIVVDPPRSGLLPASREHIAALGAPRIVYVSCNPETLGRDLAMLSGEGYTIDEIQPVDMFPHTYHIENVALLRR